MNVQDIIIAFAGSMAAIASYFLRECYLILKENKNDIVDLKIKYTDHEARIRGLEQPI